jgi:hypothetical protein
MTSVKKSNPHPTGVFRTYKKINGKEYVAYSKDKIEADKKQAEFESIAGLAPNKVFSSCGRFIGFRLILRRRIGRTPSIIMRKAVGKHKNQSIGEKPYSNSFEDIWGWTKNEWKKTHNLLSMDIYAYKDEIKQAKRLYMNDLSLHINEIESLR